MLDRPLVHHVMEWLVDRGVTDVVAVSDVEPAWLTDAIGDGSRWGCRVVHVAVEDDAGAA